MRSAKCNVIKEDEVLSRGVAYPNFGFVSQKSESLSLATPGRDQPKNPLGKCLHGNCATSTDEFDGHEIRRYFVPRENEE